MVETKSIARHYSEALIAEIADRYYKQTGLLFKSDHIDIFNLCAESIILNALCDVQICAIMGTRWEAPKS